MHRIAIIFIISLLIAGCSRISRNPDLLRADALTATDPREALRLLDSLPSAGLSETDRHFRDLLSVKAADKAYIAHTSDSLILDAAAWFKGTDLHPEALYYAGRVYSDLGDYPTALRYFQNALDSLPEDNDILRANILSQTGNLLRELKLSAQAEDYYLKSIDASLSTGDTLGAVYDYMSLCDMWLKKDSIRRAQRYLDSICLQPFDMPASIRPTLRLLQSITCFKRHDYSGALEIIRDLPDKICSPDKGICMTYAADIYLEAGIPDSAYRYARIVTEGDFGNNDKRSAYRILTDHRLKDHVGTNDLRRYADSLASSTERHYSAHEAQASIIQLSHYNYSKHEREAARQKDRNTTLIRWIWSLAVILLIGLSGWLYILLKKSQMAKGLLRMALNIVLSDRKKVGTTGSSKSEREMLIDRLRNNTAECAPVSDRIKNSSVYSALKARIDGRQCLSEDDPLWARLESAVFDVSPDFKNIFYCIVGDSQVSVDEYRTALLIKCGFTPSKIGILMNISKGGVASRKIRMTKKIFNENLGAKVLDRSLRSI